MPDGFQLRQHRLLHQQVNGIFTGDDIVVYGNDPALFCYRHARLAQCVSPTFDGRQQRQIG